MTEVTEFPASAVYDPGGEVVYIPFLALDGRVGYRVVDTVVGDRETFVYLNPSSNSVNAPDTPNVFVYEGIENDPALDESVVFVSPWSR